MARSSHPLAPTPVVLATVIGLVVIQLLVQLLDKFVAGGAISAAMVLVAPRVFEGEVWRVLSYGFLHSNGDPGHIIWNCIGLYFFGLDLERRFGAGRFAGFLVAAVVVGGVFVVAGSALGISAPMCVGFSAAVEACVVAWALYHWHAEVRFNLVLPVTGKWLLVIAGVQWLLDATSQSPYSAAAHLGGMVTGAVVVVGGRRLKARKIMSGLGFGTKLKVVRNDDKDRWVQ